MESFFWTLKLIRTFGLIDVIKALYFPTKETEASKELREKLEESYERIDKENLSDESE